MVIFSRVVACTSQPVAFNGHPSTRGRLTGLRNKPQQNQTCQHLAVVYWQLVSLLMELSIDGEKCSLILGCISGGFWQSRSHIIIGIIVYISHGSLRTMTSIFWEYTLCYQFSMEEMDCYLWQSLSLITCQLAIIVPLFLTLKFQKYHQDF